MILRHKKWSILMSMVALAAYIAKNDSGSFGCVVMSKQWSGLFRKPEKVL